MPTPATDDDLVTGIQAGCEQTVVTFYEKFRPRLMSLAWHRGLPISDAEDIVQETLTAAIAQIQTGKFEGRSTVGTWVYSIFNGRLQDHFRFKARRNRHSLSLDDTASSEALVKSHGPLACNPNEEIRLTVLEVLAAMPTRERLVLLMNKQDGLPAKEISKLLRLNRKTTEGILTAAKKRFKELVLASKENPSAGRLKAKEES